MSLEESYIFLSFVSGIVITTLGAVLCFVRIEPNEDNLRIRIARLVLVTTYFLLSVPDWLNIFGINDSENKTAATIAAASSQALLFTFTLITMIQPRYVTIKRMTVNVIIVAAGVAVFLIVDSLLPSQYVIYAAIAVVLFQMACYTRLFRRCYDRYVSQVANYYDDENKRQLFWARNSFYATLAIGILAIFSPLLSETAYNAFMCVYLVFYIWFAIHFINYVIALNYYLPAVSFPLDEETAPDSAGCALVADSAKPSEAEDGNDDKFRERMDKVIDEYVSEKYYLEPEHDKNWIIARSGTTLLFFRWYFQNVLQCDFRTWRANLRIEEAKRLIEDTPTVSMNGLATKLGFGTSQNFYHHFKKISGMTPTEYLEKNVRNRGQ